MRMVVVVAFLLSAGLARAAGFPSYVPLPAPVKIQGEVEAEAYGQAEFAVRGQAEVVRGKTWRGSVDATGLGADKRYFVPLVEAFVRAGWEVMLRDEPANPPIATFKRVRDGRELWASAEGSAAALRVVVVEQGAPVARLQLDPPVEGVYRVAETADFPFLKRFPGAKGPTTQKEGAMLVAPEAGRARSQVAAASVRKEYQLPASATALEVIVVHREALKAAGWRIVDENTGVKTAEPNVTAHFAKGAVDLWAHVTARGDRYTVTVGTS
jgi:hypothetical protein